MRSDVAGRVEVEGKGGAGVLSDERLVCDLREGLDL